MSTPVLSNACRTWNDAKGLELILTVNAYLGVLIALLAAAFSATFAADAPTSTAADSVAVFCAVFPLAWLALVTLPHWVARNVVTKKRVALTLAVIHGVLIAMLAPPLSLVLSLVQLYYCVRLALDRHTIQAPVPCA
jgi:hypothetical protein